MAKKLTLDFSKVEERSSWNTKQIPPGLHKMKITGVTDSEAQDGTAMWVFALKPTNPRYVTRMFPFYCKLQQNQLWKLRDLFIAAGQTVPKKAVKIDPNKIVGKEIAAEVEDETYNGNIRSTIQGVFSLDILDEYEENSYEDPEEDLEDVEEEYDDYSEDDLDEDLDDEEFDDEDDLDDDYEEEEDLDDEDDLEEEDDFDDEEEEEEPKPAPKKRATKAAPKKRVVRKARKG